ncbi:MAG: glutathione S-transferase family protein [Roseovarius sp.]|nr:glutathione S-transferase family protein [Roseovarius sp.]MCY4317418.1 glutathione S-transferase family protein [Roseovarius sp.]
MKVYLAPKTVSIATAILLEETGLPYEPVMLDFSKGEQMQSAYHAINPKGRVPALVLENGILTETGAILEFIAAQVPDMGLVPSDPWKSAQMRAVMYYLASTFHVNHAHKMRGSRWANLKSSMEDMTSKVPETMRESCGYIEENCKMSPFVTGSDMSVADPWLFTVCTWLKGDDVDIRDFPSLAAHYDMMMSRPSTEKVRQLGLM